MDAAIFPVISSASVLLELPREIRDSIYYYALPHPSPPRTGPAADRCQINPSERSARTYWGTERNTRLFRVNHQVSAEALEVFYSSFRFVFPPFVDVPLIHFMFRDTLTSRAKSYVKALGFLFMLTLSPEIPSTDGGRAMAQGS